MLFSVERYFFENQFLDLSFELETGDSFVGFS